MAEVIFFAEENSEDIRGQCVQLSPDLPTRRGVIFSAQSHLTK